MCSTDSRLVRAPRDNGRMSTTQHKGTSSIDLAPTRHRDFLPAGLAPRGLSRVEAARYVGISPSVFDGLVAEQRMPRPARLGRRCIWCRRQLDRALDELFNEPERGTAAAIAAPEYAL
jgi:predicted DNA-binding transcriptional regulator AlpA